MIHITRAMYRAITFAVVYVWLLTGAYIATAATYCDPQSQFLTNIGMEYIANPAYCIPEGMTDNTILDSYIITAVECINHTVSYYNAEGDIWDVSPASIINTYKNAGYRVFRNKEGSHIVVLQSSYTGLIGGTSSEYDMGNYAGSQVYTGLFKEAFLPPSTAPSCKGGDFNNPPMESCASSTVNMGTGRLSHSQEVFSLEGAPLPLSVTLYYRSTPFAPSNIGNGWSHSYEATLQTGTGNNMVLWIEGTRRIYNKYNTTYVPPKGDYSTLVKNGDTTWTITELDGLKRNFDTTYKLTSIVDRYNNTLTFTYISGKLSSVTDANGRAVTFGYNGTTGKLETITDPRLNAHTLGYTGNNLTSVIPPGNKGQWTYTYNASNGLLETKKDPADNTSRYAYYPSSTLVQKATDPNLKERSYTYPTTLGGSGKVPAYFPISMVSEKTFNFVEKDGNGWIYTFDTDSMNVRTATDPLGKTTTYYYNTDSSLRAKTVPFNGALRYTTFYAYDSNGNLTGETDPLDLSLPQYSGINPAEVNTNLITSTSTPIAWSRNYTYDTPANYYQIKTITDNRGTSPLTTTYDRYPEGSLLVTRTTAPGETTGTTLISYQRQNANGTLASMADANGKTTSFSYYPVNDTTRADGTAGMLQTVSTPDGVKLTFTAYDKNANLTELHLTDTNNAEIPVKTTQGYDTINRIISILKESTANPIRFSPNLTTFGYDNDGNLSSLIDAENHETKYEHTYQGQIKKITNTINGLLVDTVLEYGGTGCPACNGADRLTAVKDPNHVKNNLSGTVYQYDAAGRIQYETDPISKKLRYTYYDNGLLKEKFDATNGDPGTLLVTYLYNNRGQLTEKQYPDNTSIKFTYKTNGWLETAGNYTGTTATFSYTNEYYDNGRLKSVTDNSGRKVSYDQYDALGQKKQVTVLKGGGTDERVISYDYDSANRPWHITSGAGIFTYAYDERGRPDTLNYPNGTQADWDFDDLDRLTGVTHRVNGGSSFATYSYPYHDQVGNITEVLDDKSATYFYDEVYRLLNVVSLSPENFTYDDDGNRKSGPGPMDSGPYVHNYDNQITIGRKLVYGYNDNRGNQTSRTVPGTSGKTWSQIWDNENRLKTVEKTKTMLDGTERKTVNFTYDPFGRRIGKAVEKTYYDVTTSQYVTKTESYVYVYDNEDIVLEIYTPQTGAQEKTYYTHGPGIDEPLAMERSGQFYYYHADGLGSIITITNGAHGFAQRYEYEAFGMATQTTSFRNSYVWTAREYDSETGLYYNRARYYDPMEGKFISKDPISFSGGDVNLYGYTGNNPISFTDPSGLISSDPWYGYNDPNFHWFFHRCWKKKGGPRVRSREEVEEAHGEWLRRGSPPIGRCWNDKKKQCPEPDPEPTPPFPNWMNKNTATGIGIGIGIGIGVGLLCPECLVLIPAL